MRMRPPPAVPSALTLAPVKRMSLPVTVMSPPRAARAVRVAWGRVVWVRAEASSRPPTVTLPPSPPPSTMAPERPPTVRASTMPDMLMALRAASRAVAAWMTTRPPAALIRPDCSISAFLPAVSPLVGTATWRKPSPERSRVARSPAPRPTRPSGTLMVPLFSTWPPRSAA